MRKVFSSGPMSTGTIGVSVGPMSKPRLRKPVLQPAGVGPQVVTASRLVLQHLEGREHAGGVGRRKRRREDERPTVVLQVVNDAFADAATKPPIEASDLENVPAMMSTSSVMPKCAAVPSPLGPRTPSAWASSSASAAPYFRAMRTRPDVGDVAFHRVHAVHHDHRAPARPVPLQPALEVAEVAVVEALGLAVGHLRAVHDRGVIELVEVDHLAAADEAGDQPQVGRSSRSRRRGRPPCRGTRPGRASSCSCRSSVPFRNRLPVQPEP